MILQPHGSKRVFIDSIYNCKHSLLQSLEINKSGSKLRQVVFFCNNGW